MGGGGIRGHHPWIVFLNAMSSCALLWLVSFLNGLTNRSPFWGNWTFTLKSWTVPYVGLRNGFSNWLLGTLHNMPQLWTAQKLDLVWILHPDEIDGDWLGVSMTRRTLFGRQLFLILSFSNRTTRISTVVILSRSFLSNLGFPAWFYVPDKSTQSKDRSRRESCESLSFDHLHVTKANDWWGEIKST